MYDAEGNFTGCGNGNITRKWINKTNEGHYFGEVTIVTKRVHKDKEYKTYHALQVNGPIAKQLYHWYNEGDQIIVTGDMVDDHTRSVLAYNMDAQGNPVGEPFKIPKKMLAVRTLSGGKLTKKTMDARKAAHEAKQGQAQSGQNTPQQPQSQAPAQPQQQMAQPQQPQNEPPMDFDDDIPF